MSIEAFLTAGLFKHDQAGRTIVYPFGPLLRGYFVADGAAERRIRSKLARGMIATIMTGLAGILAFEMVYGRVGLWSAEAWLIAVSILAVLEAGYLIWLKGLVHGMPPAAERMGLIESVKLRSQATPDWFLRGLVWSQIMGAICATVAFVLIFVMFAMTRSPTAVAMAATICLLAVMLVVVAAMLNAILRCSRPSRQSPE
jgi:hypothetical protein